MALFSLCMGQNGSVYSSTVYSSIITAQVVLNFLAILIMPIRHVAIL